MNCQKIFEDFNSSKFVVYVSLLVFTILFALRLDESIHISWWAVFGPLWIWKSLVICGAFVGVLVWIIRPEYRASDSSYTHFKSMLISLSLQLLLLMFELLVCDKLETDRHFWSLVFIPLIFISLLSILVSVWALKNERDFELELFCSVNILQFVFIALRLDRFITWSWVVVFVPFWILLCLAIIAALYALIFSAILFRTPEVSLEQRRASFYTALAYTFVVLPLLAFFVLLSSKLDANSQQFLSEFHYSTFDTFPPHLKVPGIHAMHHHNHHHTKVHHIHHLPGHNFASSSIDSPSTSSSSSISTSSSASTSTSGPIFMAASVISTAPMTASASASTSLAISSFLPANPSDMNYFTVFMPLYLTLSLLILMSFSAKGGNLWWFGMRKDFCSCMLLLCPCLREYANISCNLAENRRSGLSETIAGGNNATSNLVDVRVELVPDSGGKAHRKGHRPVITQPPQSNNNGLFHYAFPRLDLPD